MWVYVQRTGELWLNGALFAHGYAGWEDGDGIVEPGEGKNNPGAEAIRNVGPLPGGIYTIGLPFKHDRLGDLTMRLEPDPGNDMHGRSAFMIHADRRDLPGAASEGCIVLPLPVRREIALRVLDGERTLTVVAEAPPATLEGTPA